MVAKPRGKSRKQALFVRKSLFTGNNTCIKVRIILERGLRGPTLPLKIDVVDPVFVLKCKVECALKLLRETQGDSAVGVTATAEDIELEYRGIPLRDMTNIERYGIENGSEIAAAYVPQPSERDVVPREENFLHLDAQLMAEPGVPSTGTIKRIVTEHGKRCQVCWRKRWFRAEILNIYSTSILLRWLDWDDAEWPNFFVYVALASTPGGAPQERDETWRLRWHSTQPNSKMPIVTPRYRELPPMNWVKAFLRTYATSDETQMLREIQTTLPRELVEARQLAASRHKCIILGPCGVGKSTLMATFCAGPPRRSTSADDSLRGGFTGRGGVDSGGLSPYWPTVGTKCATGVVHTPGLHDLQLEMWDTSGNPRFKPLSLVFYRQAQSVILVFDVKSMASFRALSAVGGWLHEFTRLTGHSPRNFPFVLVGNKAEDDLMHGRQVMEEDVREWLYKDGGKMPYLETSFGGDPNMSWRHAEHVFRTVARNADRLSSNFGRHRPPDTVRVAPEAEYAEADASFVGGESFVGSFVKSTTRSFVDKTSQSVVGRATRDLGENLAQLVRDPLEKAKHAAEEMVLCGKRSIEKGKDLLDKDRRNGVLVIRDPNK